MGVHGRSLEAREERILGRVPEVQEGLFELSRLERARRLEHGEIEGTVRDVDADEVVRTIATDLVEDVYAGQVTGLFAHLLDEGDVSTDDLKEIKRLIARAEKKKRR
ncbi:MAG: BlaI/MecI/CopY family transcriptional regulator [Planctomycetota bacterium]